MLLVHFEPDYIIWTDYNLKQTTPKWSKYIAVCLNGVKFAHVALPRRYPKSSLPLQRMHAKG
jgi:hypothetical protein